MYIFVTLAYFVLGNLIFSSFIMNLCTTVVYLDRNIIVDIWPILENELLEKKVQVEIWKKHCYTVPICNLVGSLSRVAYLRGSDPDPVQDGLDSPTLNLTANINCRSLWCINVLTSCYIPVRFDFLLQHVHRTVWISQWICKGW